MTVFITFAKPYLNFVYCGTCWICLIVLVWRYLVCFEGQKVKFETYRSTTEISIQMSIFKLLVSIDGIFAYLCYKYPYKSQSTFSFLWNFFVSRAIQFFFKAQCNFGLEICKAPSSMLIFSPHCLVGFRFISMSLWLKDKIAN